MHCDFKVLFSLGPHMDGLVVNVAFCRVGDCGLYIIANKSRYALAFAAFTRIFGISRYINFFFGEERFLKKGDMYRMCI